MSDYIPGPWAWRLFGGHSIRLHGANDESVVLATVSGRGFCVRVDGWLLPIDLERDALLLNALAEAHVLMPVGTDKRLSKLSLNENAAACQLAAFVEEWGVRHKLNNGQIRDILRIQAAAVEQFAIEKGAAEQ